MVKKSGVNALWQERKVVVLGNLKIPLRLESARKKEERRDE